jgi:hypothetical protein
MAGENLARLVRERAARLADTAARARRQDGDTEGAEVIRDLAEDIRKLPIGDN